MITTLIFDLGNVVLCNDWHDHNQAKFDEFFNYYGINYDAAERGWNASWPDYKVGKISEDEFWNIFLAVANAKNTEIDKAKKIWRKYQCEHEQMLSLIQKLAQKYTLAVISNTGKEWMEYKKETFKLEDHFSVIIGSGDAGIVKPNPAIYELALKQLNTHAGECIFVDDTVSTLPPAEKLGMQTIQFKTQSQLEVELKKKGIIA